MGLSLTAVAERSGLDRALISRLANAEHSPTDFTLEKIAKALGINVSELEPSSD